MKHQSEKPNIVVLGAGAVGCYFGGMLARAGHNVTLEARAERVAADDGVVAKLRGDGKNAQSSQSEGA
jgi:ketopantoate reductase